MTLGINNNNSGPNYINRISAGSPLLGNKSAEEIAEYESKLSRALVQLNELLEQFKDNPELKSLIENSRYKVLQALDKIQQLPAEELSKQENIDFIENAIKDAHATQETVRESVSPQDPDQIPYNTDYPINPGQDTFDTSIPRKEDGSIDIDAVIRKLHDLFYYMYHGDCSNFNIYTATAGFLTNIAGVWDSLSNEDKNKFNKIINTVPSTSSGKALGDLLAESVIYGKFYAFEGNQNLLFKFIDEISAKFEGKDNPFFRSFLEGLKKTKESFPEWRDKHINVMSEWVVSFKDFLKEQSLANASIGRSQQTADLFKLITRNKIQELEALAGGDPFILFYLLLMLLFEQNDNYQLKIAGVGKTIEKLDDLTKQATDIGLLFQQINARGKTDSSVADFEQSYKMIDELINKIEHFGKEFESDPRLQDSFGEIAEQIKHFTANSSDGGLSYTGDPGNMSINEYLEISRGSSETRIGFVNDFFKNCCEGKVDPNNINPETKQPHAPNLGPNYTQIINDIQSFTKAPLNMNSTLTIKMEDIKSAAEQFGALMTKFMKDPNDLISRMLQRMQQ